MLKIYLEYFLKEFQKNIFRFLRKILQNIPEKFFKNSGKIQEKF